MFYLLIVFLFSAAPMGTMADKQVLIPKFEPSAEACRADADKALSLEIPDGVIIGTKCDGPFQDPTVPKQKV